MELKAVNEYKTPEYSTAVESKNKVFGFIMNCKKVSIGVLVILLLCSNGNALEDKPVNVDLTHSIDGGLQTYVSHQLEIAVISGIIQLILYLISIILIVYTGIIFIKNRKQENADKKQKIKKRGIICIIVAILLPILSILIANVSDVIINSLYH